MPPSHTRRYIKRSIASFVSNPGSSIAVPNLWSLLPLFRQMIDIDLRRILFDITLLAEAKLPVFSFELQINREGEENANLN